MNSKKLGRWKFAGAFGLLLLVGSVTPSSVFAASPQAPLEIAGLPVEEETFFLEMQQAERRKGDFIEGFGKLRSALAEKKVRVEEVWAGGARLYLKVEVPADTVAGRNALVDEMFALPLVAQVISSHAAPAALRDVHVLEKFDARAEVPEARLRGFREKRRNFRPDLSAPHTGEIIVRYLDAETETPARLVAARLRVAALHAQVKARTVRALGVGDAPAGEGAIPMGICNRAC